MDRAGPLNDVLTVRGEHYPCGCTFDTPTQGSITGDRVALWSAFMARRCSIATEDGRHFEIIVTTYAPSPNAVRFKLL